MTKGNQLLRLGILAVLCLVVYLVLSFTVEGIPSPVELIKGLVSGSGNSTYSQLNNLIEDPESDSGNSRTITFTAYVSGEPEEITFDDDPGVTHVYQVAWIARNEEKYFLIDVRWLSSPLEVGQYYTITGKCNGSVYWTENSQRVSVLDLLVSTAKPFTPAVQDVNEGPSYTNGSYEFTFQGAHYGESIYDEKVIVAYFDFTNNASNDASPGVTSLSFYQGNSLSTSEIMRFEAKEVDPNALNGSFPIGSTKTYAGKTTRYYVSFTLQDDVTEDEDNLYLVRYNDNFEITDEIAIPILKDFKTWEAAQ